MHPYAPIIVFSGIMGRKKKYKIAKKNFEKSLASSGLLPYFVFCIQERCCQKFVTKFCDDTGLVLSIYCTGKTKYLQSYSFGYRKRENSITSSSNNISLDIIEILIFQDVLNSKKFLFAFFAKACGHLINVFKNRNALKNDKYQVYINDSKQYKNDILGKIYNYNDSNLLKKLVY